MVDVLDVSTGPMTIHQELTLMGEKVRRRLDGAAEYLRITGGAMPGICDIEIVVDSNTCYDTWTRLHNVATDSTAQELLKLYREARHAARWVPKPGYRPPSYTTQTNQEPSTQNDEDEV